MGEEMVDNRQAQIDNNNPANDINATEASNGDKEWKHSFNIFQLKILFFSIVSKNNFEAFYGVNMFLHERTVFFLNSKTISFYENKSC